MPGHIGIVACSAPGAALCFQTICTEAAALMGPHEHPEISMHAFSFAEHLRCMETGDWRGAGELLRRSAEKVASLGATFAICPDNTAHQALDDLADSPIPWLHIAEVVAERAREAGFERLGLLGTRYLMEGPVYPGKLDARGVEWRVPEPEERDTIHRIIFEELVLGRVTDASTRALLDIIEALASRHRCDAVVLGCTELPLAVPEGRAALPTLDSTRLLARAAIRRAVKEEAP